MQMMIDIDQLNTEALAAPANRPVIGITGNFNEGQLKLLPGYFRSIEAAGGTPWSFRHDASPTPRSSV